MSPKEKHLLYSELAKLTGAGFPIDKAADTLLNQHASGSAATFARGIKDGLARGTKIHEAIRETPLDISELELSVIESAEQGGKLEDGFDHLADYFKLLQTTRRQMFKNALYPIAMVHAAIPLFAIASSVLSGESFLKILLFRFAFVYAVGVVLFIVARMLLKAGQQSETVDRFLTSIPVIGKARRALALTRFCKVFHIHLLSGGNISDAVEMAGTAAQSAAVKGSALRMVPAIKGGNTLGPQMLESRIFPKDFAHAVHSAEEAGELDTEMSRWAGYMHSTAVTSMENVGEWLPRIFYVLIMAFVTYLIFQGWYQYSNSLMDSMGR
jgi:type II secretory pathway component PulF